MSSLDTLVFDDILPQTITLGLTSGQHIPALVNVEFNTVLPFFVVSSWHIIANEDVKRAHTHIHSQCIAAFAVNGKLLAVFLQTNGSVFVSVMVTLTALTKLLPCSTVRESTLSIALSMNPSW